MNYLLDTNIVLTYLRNNETAQKIEKELNLFSVENTLLISVVTVGELKSIAIQNNWAERKVNLLLNKLNEFIITDIHIEEIVNQYAKIDAFSQGKFSEYKTNFSSRNMGKNDLWIAATASALGLELVTMDNDFNHLKGVFIELTTISW